MDGWRIVTFLVDVFGAQHMLVIRWSPDDLPFRSKRVTVFFFVVHEEYPGAVALTGYTRGDHTHLLDSCFLVRSSTALRLLSGEYRVFLLSGLCRRYLRWWPSLTLFYSLTQTPCIHQYHELSYTLLILLSEK